LCILQEFCVIRRLIAIGYWGAIGSNIRPK
jgi:hypothetical protein